MSSKTASSKCRKQLSCIEKVVSDFRNSLSEDEEQLSLLGSSKLSQSTIQTSCFFVKRLNDLIRKSTDFTGELKVLLNIHEGLLNANPNRKLEEQIPIFNERNSMQCDKTGQIMLDQQQEINQQLDQIVNVVEQMRMQGLLVISTDKQQQQILNNFYAEIINTINEVCNTKQVDQVTSSNVFFEVKRQCLDHQQSLSQIKEGKQVSRQYNSNIRQPKLKAKLKGSLFMMKERDQKMKKTIHTEEYFEQIIHMKDRLQKSGKKLLKQEIRSLPFLGISDKRIMHILQNIQIEKQTLFCEQINQWQQIIGEALLQVCKLHKRKVFYICNSDYLQKHIYLCNKCILQGHQDHEIICKAHKQPISRFNSKANIQAHMDERIDQVQHFVCKKCETSKQDQYHLISKCHFKVIKQVCADLQCIKKDQFIICPSCQDNHSSHKKILFDKNFLVDEFRVDKNIDFGYVLTDSKQRLKFRPIVKMIGALTDKLWPVIRLLQSFAIDDKMLQQWIKEVLKKGKKEDMCVLWGVLSQRGRNEQQKYQFLEVFNDQLQLVQEQAFEKVWKILQQLGVKIQQMANISQHFIKQRLDKKYQRVQIKEESVSPMKLCTISPFHHNKIIDIEIEEEGEQNDEKINQQQRAQRQLFFNHIAYNSLKNNNALMLLLKYQQNMNYQRIKQAKLQRYSDKLITLRDSLNQMREKYSAMRKKSYQLQWILDKITQKSITRLQTLTIKYSMKCSDVDVGEQLNRYSICAFSLFESISAIESLRMLNICGIQVKDIQLFAQCCRATKQTSPKRRQMSRTKQRLAELLLKNQKWLKQLNPSRIALSINTVFEFNTSDCNLLDKLANAIGFMHMFESVAEITVAIIMNQWNRSSPKEIIKLFSEFFSLLIRSKVKFNQDQQGQQILQLLLDSLSQNIVEQGVKELSFCNVSKVCCQVQQNLKNHLINISQKCKITHAAIQYCQYYLVPSVTHLQSLSLSHTILCYDGDHLLQQLWKNSGLKSLSLNTVTKMGGNSYDLSRLYRLQNLQLEWSNIINDSALNTLHGSNIKILRICDSQYIGITKQGLMAFFPKLQNLTELRIQNFSIDFGLLSLIPSNNMQKLAIVSNHNITNQDIRAIDSRWPYIIHLTIYKCGEINEQMFDGSKFKGLVRLETDLRYSNQLLWAIKLRGIQLQDAK